MKYNESIPFNPMWCSIIAADLTHTGGPRKRFVEEYESNLCYRRCAKDLITDGNFYGVTVLPCAKRTEGLKIASVLYYLLYADKTPKYTKLVMLFGKEYGSVASLVSEIYKNEKDGMLKLAKRMSGLYGSEIGNVAVFAIFLLASPESYLEQNRMAFSRLCNTLSQMTRKTDAEKPLSEQERFFVQYGMTNQKNFSDLVTNAVLVSGTNDLMLEDDDGDIGHFDWFSFSDYGVSCSAEMLSTLALLDAGVANSPAYDRTITKQKFTEAQRAVAKSLYFTKVGEDGKVVRGDLFSLMDDEHIKIDDSGRILADETSSLAVAAIVNLYNTMLPMYIAIRSLGEAYNDELKGSISNELFGGTKNSNEDALVKQIEQLQKQLDAAKESEARAVEAANIAEQKLNQSKKRENALVSKLEAAYSEIDELMAQIPESAEEDEAPDEPDEPAEEKAEENAMDYSGALDDILKKNTVVIVGGNQNLMKKFQVTHPDASIVAKDMIAVCDQQIRNADVVMFKADSLSHALYGKCKAICHKHDVPFCYLPNVASIPRMEQSMCEQLGDILG